MSWKGRQFHPRMKPEAERSACRLQYPLQGSGQTLADFTPDTEELSAMLSMMKQSEAFQEVIAS